MDALMLIGHYKQMFERNVNFFCFLIHAVTYLFQHLSGDAVKKKPVK